MAAKAHGMLNLISCKQIQTRRLVIFLILAASHARAEIHPAPDRPIALAYTSVLDGYRQYASEPVQAWRDSVDTVGRIGGWRSYLKEPRGGDIHPGAEAEDKHYAIGKGRD